MLQFVAFLDRASAMRQRGTRALLHLHRVLACRVHLLRLAKINQGLTAIDRRLRGARDEAPLPVPIEALRRAGAQVGAELANPPIRSIEGLGILNRYLAGVDEVIRAYATVEAMLDEKTLRRLGWVEQQIRLEYLRAGLDAHDGGSVSAVRYRSSTDSDRSHPRALPPGHRPVTNHGY